jgi:hypothetical protein
MVLTMLVTMANIQINQIILNNITEVIRWLKKEQMRLVARQWTAV